jgi:hypothetical protein
LRVNDLQAPQEVLGLVRVNNVIANPQAGFGPVLDFPDKLTERVSETSAVAEAKRMLTLGVAHG